jgi:hypothetical protein
MTVLRSLSGNFYDTWAVGGPPGSVFTANTRGWFNMKECETWFEKVFLKYLEGRIPKEEVKVLIMDNLSSHLSLNIMEQCRENNIRLIFLPPNSTHLTQPLDVAVFAPLKKQWRKELDEYKESCTTNNIRNCTIPKDRFASLLKATLDKNIVNNAQNIRYQNISSSTFFHTSSFTGAFPPTFSYWQRYRTNTIPVHFFDNFSLLKGLAHEIF